MVNYHRNGLDILGTIGNCHIATKQVLVTVQRVVYMPRLYASFLSALSSHQLKCLRWQPTLVASALVARQLKRLRSVLLRRPCYCVAVG
jgi:hypothetical protein